MGENFILALDQGTTSSRAILFDREGVIHGLCNEEFKQIYPQPGWVEHDPEDIWRTQCNTARKVLADAGLTAEDVAAIGITNQRETAMVWDRTTGEPIHNAIVWQCRRTTDICEQLAADGLTETFRDRTGLVLDAYFSGTKVKWLLDHVPGARERAAKGELCFGTIDAWLLYKLTGKHATDPTNASRTLLYNIFEHRWDDTLLEHLEVPRQMLPEVMPTSGIFGETTVFGGSIPIAGMCGDQQSALFGQTAFESHLIEAVYFSSSGGHTANNEDVWDASETLPYLRGRNDPYDSASPHHTWESSANRTTVLSGLERQFGGSVRGFYLGDTADSGRLLTMELLRPNGSRE
ncbi:MAG: FGGY family carbohydrate kinase, partial [Candidatus Hydrogenedentota bacterium]